MICKYAGVHSIKFGFYSDRIMVCNYIIATLINHPASKTEYETAIIMWCQVSILFHNVFKLFFFCLVDSGHIRILYRRYWNFMVIHSLRGNNLSCETFQTGHMISPPKRTKFSQKKCPLAKRSYIVSSHPKIMRKKEDKTKRDRNIANINRVKQTNTEPKSNVYELDQERSFHCRFVCADILCFSNYIFPKWVTIYHFNYLSKCEKWMCIKWMRLNERKRDRG